jgi:hypothetical protein
VAQRIIEENLGHGGMEPFYNGQVWDITVEDMDESNVYVYCHTGSWEIRMWRRTWWTWDDVAGYNKYTETAPPYEVRFNRTRGAFYSFFGPSYMNVTVFAPWTITPGHALDIQYPHEGGESDGDFRLRLIARSASNSCDLNWRSYNW